MVCLFGGVGFLKKSLKKITEFLCLKYLSSFNAHGFYGFQAYYLQAIIPVTSVFSDTFEIK